MTKEINVTLLPPATSEAVAGSTAVVIDLLRASTTITTALAAGARQILPCLEVEEARRAASQLPDAMLGGEREGLRIEGFDFGNSPAEYTTERVGGKSIVFTTTNGTRALQWCQPAADVLIGAFVNLTAVCRELSQATRVELVCAGTNRQVSREDVIVAGAIVRKLESAAEADWNLGDGARIALATWQEVESQQAKGMTLAECLHHSQGGRNLLRIGQQGDIEWAADIDRFDCVPKLKRDDWAVCLR